MKADPPRVFSLAAVVLLHVGLLAVVTVALHYRGEHAAAEAPALVLLSLPPTPADHERLPDQAPAFTPAPSTAITVPPLVPSGSGGIDWGAEAERAAVAAAAAVPARPLGENPASRAPLAPGSPAVVVHQAGEQYREADGSKIVFVNDHCFVASDAVPPGTPDLIARARPTRTVCKGDPGWSRADLFRDLPAYRRYHQEPLPGGR